MFQLTSSSVRQVILDVKVGPPSYEKGLARDVLSVVSLFASPFSFGNILILVDMVLPSYLPQGYLLSI